MIVNPDMDGCTKSRKNRKNAKRQPTKNQKSIEIEIQLSGRRVFTFSLTGGLFAPLPSRQLRHC